MRLVAIFALFEATHAALALNRFRTTAGLSGLRMSVRKPRRVLEELPFSEARAMARSMGMSSREEWEEYSCPGAYRLPNDPDVVWAADWQGWGDWQVQHVESAARLASGALGSGLRRSAQVAQSRMRVSGMAVRFGPQLTIVNPRVGVILPFEEARGLVRGLGLASSEEYTQFLASGADLERAAPESWNGGHALRFREKAAAVGVDTGRLPAKPDLKYRVEWAGWEDWLGPC